MGKYDAPVYDDCRKWIQKKLEKGMSWESIRLACKSDISGLTSFLKSHEEEDEWPHLSVDDWSELVDECEEYEKKQQDYIILKFFHFSFDTNAVFVI